MLTYFNKKINIEFLTSSMPDFQEKYLFHHRCKECQNIIPPNKKNNKFCSKTCSATFNNRGRVLTDDTKTKISNTLKLKKKKKLYICNCIICSKEFTHDQNPKKQTCSKRCFYILNREINSKRGKKSAQVRKKRSSDEIKLFELCFFEFKDVKANYVISNGWDCDILIDNKYAILWNGPWHYKQLSFSNHSLKQVQNRDLIKIKLFESLGYQVLIFEDRKYNPISAFNEICDIIKK